jgi:Bifunctional DNA primase/polymerase, N-terminal
MSAPPTGAPPTARPRPSRHPKRRREGRGVPGDSEERAPEGRLEVALAQAALGRRVFPAGDDRRPFVRWKLEATTDEAKVREWWARWPAAEVAWALPPGVLVVDVSDPAVFLASGLPIPTAPGQETRRGFSLLYSYTPGPIVRRAVPGADLVVGGELFVIVSSSDSFTRLMTILPHDILSRAVGRVEGRES